MLYAKVEPQDREAICSEMKSATDAKWYRRLKVIDLSGQGYSVPDLSRLLDLSEATIRSYIHHFNRTGIAGLRPGYGRGRPPLLALSQDEWLDVLAQSPADLPLLETKAHNWTQARLRQYLKLYHQIEVSQSTIAKSLRSAGIHWRRAKLRVHSPDPLYQVKRQRIAQLQQLALEGELTCQAGSHPRTDEPPKRAFLAFLDSTDLHWCPDLGATYVPAGRQMKVDSPGYENPWYALFGSLIFPSGEGLYTIHERKRSAELLAHLQLLLDCDTDAFWFVVLDNASAHSTAAVNTFAQDHQHRLELVYLPTYSPHLNLIERLWRLMRSQLTRNRFFADLPSLAKAAAEWLGTLPFAQFCSLMGLNEQQLGFLPKPFSE
jgi:transposase